MMKPTKEIRNTMINKMIMRKKKKKEIRRNFLILINLCYFFGFIKYKTCFEV